MQLYVCRWLSPWQQSVCTTIYLYRYINIHPLTIVPIVEFTHIVSISIGTSPWTPKHNMSSYNTNFLYTLYLYYTIITAFHFASNYIAYLPTLPQTKPFELFPITNHTFIKKLIINYTYSYFQTQLIYIYIYIYNHGRSHTTCRHIIINIFIWLHYITFLLL